MHDRRQHQICLRIFRYSINFSPRSVSRKTICNTGISLHGKRRSGSWDRAIAQHSARGPIILRWSVFPFSFFPLVYHPPWKHIQLLPNESKSRRSPMPPFFNSLDQMGFTSRPPTHNYHQDIMIPHSDVTHALSEEGKTL